MASSGSRYHCVCAADIGAVLVGVGIIGFFMWDNYKSHAGAPAPAATITALQCHVVNNEVALCLQSLQILA